MTKEDVKRWMHLCAKDAAKNVTKWNKEGPAEPDLTHPVVSLDHLHRIIDWVYTEYADRVEDNSAKEEIYYIHVDDSPMGHPVYYIGTFMVLFMAGVKKIWIEYPRSYEWFESKYMYDPVAYCMLEAIVNRFTDQCIARTNILLKDADMAAIEFVNHMPEVTHVIEMGNQNASYWRTGRYRENVTLHTPTSNKVWIDYQYAASLQKDKNLYAYGDRCWECAFNYECFYSSRIEETYSRDVYAWMDYEDQWRWNEFAEEERNWRKKHPNYVDRIPMYLFGDDSAIARCLADMPECLRPVIKDDFTLDAIFYDFMDLIKR